MYAKVYMRVEKILVTLTQVWKCRLRNEREHCSPVKRPPEVVAEEGKTFNGEESKPID